MFNIDYFNRTGYEKKRKAVEWCGKNAQSWLKNDTHEDSKQPQEKPVIRTGPTPEKRFDDLKPHTEPPLVGDIVAVPFFDNCKQFWLGKVIRVNESTILLGWLQRDENDRYKLKIGASWEEVIIFISCCLFLKYCSEHQHMYLSY